MKHYKPSRVPNREEWLALTQQERIGLVLKYHREKRILMREAEFHAALHVLVEDQVAAGDELPVDRTVRRLIAEGLDRHQAIHAIIGAMSNNMLEVLRQARTPPARYFAELETLTAHEYLKSNS